MKLLNSRCLILNEMFYLRAVCLVLIPWNCHFCLVILFSLVLLGRFFISRLLCVVCLCITSGLIKCISIIFHLYLRFLPQDLVLNMLLRMLMLILMCSDCNLSISFYYHSIYAFLFILSILIYFILVYSTITFVIKVYYLFVCTFLVMSLI